MDYCCCLTMQWHILGRLHVCDAENLLRLPLMLGLQADGPAGRKCWLKAHHPLCTAAQQKFLLQALRTASLGASIFLGT